MTSYFPVSLVELRIDHNQLESFTNDVTYDVANSSACANKSCSLTKLQLSFNYFLTFSPFFFSYYPNLQFLHLNNNSLKTLALNWFKKTTNLNFLNVSSNLIVDVNCSGMPQFPNLTYFNLAANFIAEFDKKLDFPTLRTLDMRSNQLTSLEFLTNISFNDLVLVTDNNPWNCSCGFINNYRNFLSKGNITFNCTAQDSRDCIRCYTPPALKGRSPQTVNKCDVNAATTNAATTTSATANAATTPKRSFDDFYIIVIIAASAGVTVVLSVTLIAALCSRRKNRKRKLPTQTSSSQKNQQPVKLDNETASPLQTNQTVSSSTNQQLSSPDKRLKSAAAILPSTLPDSSQASQSNASPSFRNKISTRLNKFRISTSRSFDKLHLHSYENCKLDPKSSRQRPSSGNHLHIFNKKYENVSVSSLATSRQVTLSTSSKKRILYLSKSENDLTAPKRTTSKRHPDTQSVYSEIYDNEMDYPVPLSALSKKQTFLQNSESNLRVFKQTLSTTYPDNQSIYSEIDDNEQLDIDNEQSVYEDGYIIQPAGQSIPNESESALQTHFKPQQNPNKDPITSSSGYQNIQVIPDRKLIFSDTKITQKVYENVIE